ncbi:hypothetical protein QQ045_021856 [Rhodiola kirilowii]
MYGYPAHFSFVGLTGGDGFVCGLLMDSNQPYCWGSSSYIQMGVPQPMVKGSEYLEISVGDYHLCGLRKPFRGKLRDKSFVDCWGYNITKSYEFDGQIQSITAGSEFNCGLFSQNRSVFCWGDETSSHVISLIPHATRFQRIAAGGYHVCGILEGVDSREVCRLRMADGTRVYEIAAGDYFTCGVVADRSFRSTCWGCRFPNFSSSSCFTRTLIFDFNFVHSVQVEELPLLSQSVTIKEEQRRWRCDLFERKRKDPARVRRAQKFTYEELERATNGFKEESQVGRGNFSCVFKGEERLLVYEFMAHGSLHQHLHSDNNALREQLDRVRRVTIAVQAARGIEYLHCYACPPVIHRDIKSSNILIDEEHNARVSDFGLSLLGPVDSSSPLAELPVRTLGYLDPEYYRLHYLTTKSDFEEGNNIVEWVVPLIKSGDITSILDPVLKPPTDIEALKRIANVACKCVRMQGKERPPMDKVTTSLERALAQLMGSPCGLYRSTYITNRSGLGKQFMKLNCLSTSSGVVAVSDDVVIEEGAFVEIGYISSVHGLQGEVRVKSMTDFQELRFSQPGKRWLRQNFGGKDTVRVVELVGGRGQPGQKSWILKFAGIDTVEEAKLLIGSSLLVQEEDRPELVDGEFYTRDLIGMKVLLKVLYFLMHY